MSTARDEARNQINLLLRSSHWIGAETLADRLAACQPEAPCLSGACPICNLAAQRAHVDLVAPALARTQGDMALATVIDSRRAVHVGQLQARELHREFRTDLAEVLAGFGIPAVGGFELSQNWDEAERFRPRWVAQAHLSLPYYEIKRLKIALKNAFPSTRGVLRPVRIDRFDCARSGAAYNNKNRVMRRIALMPKPDSEFSTRWKPLGAEGRVELALAQLRAGLDASSFVCGFALHEENGRMRLARLR